MIVLIHQKYLTWRKLDNPLVPDSSFVNISWHLVHKKDYVEDDSWGENIERISQKWYVHYYAHKTIKAFIFTLIKQYTNDKD